MKKSEFKKEMHALYLQRYPKLSRSQINRLMMLDYSETSDFAKFTIPLRSDIEIEHFLFKEQQGTSKNTLGASAQNSKSSGASGAATRHPGAVPHAMGPNAPNALNGQNAQNAQTTANMQGGMAGMHGQFPANQACFMMPQGYPYPLMMPWHNGQPQMPYMFMNPMMPNYTAMAAMYSGNAANVPQMPQQPYVSTLSAVEVDPGEQGSKQPLQITQHAYTGASGLNASDSHQLDSSDTHAAALHSSVIPAMSIFPTSVVTSSMDGISPNDDGECSTVPTDPGQANAGGQSDGKIHKELPFLSLLLGEKQIDEAPAQTRSISFSLLTNDTSGLDEMKHAYDTLLKTTAADGTQPKEAKKKRKNPVQDECKVEQPKTKKRCKQVNESDGEDEQLYEIERIIGKKITVNGRINYLVKWTGYDEEEASWVDYAPGDKSWDSDLDKIRAYELLERAYPVILDSESNSPDSFGQVKAKLPPPRLLDDEEEHIKQFQERFMNTESVKSESSTRTVLLSNLHQTADAPTSGTVVMDDTAEPEIEELRRTVESSQPLLGTPTAALPASIDQTPPVSAPAPVSANADAYDESGKIVSFLKTPSQRFDDFLDRTIFAPDLYMIKRTSSDYIPPDVSSASLVP